MRKIGSKAWHISTRRYNVISIRNSFSPYTYRARTSYVGLILLLRLTLPPTMEYFLQPQKQNLREILLSLFPRTNEIILAICRKDCFCQIWRKLVTITTPKARTQICICNVSNNHSKEVLGTRICAFFLVTGAVSYRDGHLTFQLTFPNSYDLFSLCQKSHSTEGTLTRIITNSGSSEEVEFFFDHGESWKQFVYYTYL